jgi:alpha-1,6-mannosyltransferase
MSVGDPLGASPRGTTIEFGAQALEAPAARIANRRTSTLAAIGLGGLLATALVIALSASNTNTLLPETVRPVPAWLAGPFMNAGPSLSSAALIGVLVLMFGAYMLALRNIDGLSDRAVIVAIAGFTAIVLIAPPLLSTDVFSYQEYARMGTIYGANPYTLGPHAIALDPLYSYVDAKWITTPTAYGPIFTLLSYPLAMLDVAASVLAYKLIAALSALAIVAGVWTAARMRGLNPARAAALIGLNPLVVVYGIGGGHNDLLMLAFMTGGICLMLAGRDKAGGGSIVVAAGIKLTGAILLPFALLSREEAQPGRRRDFMIGAATVAAMIAVATLIMFGPGSVKLLSTLSKNQSNADWHSIPGFFSDALGLGTIAKLTAYMLGATFLAIFVWLIRRVYRRELDWIAGAGWATFWMLATAGSVLPWYVAWLLPLAALGGDRRLYRTAAVLSGVILMLQLIGYIPHASPNIGL